MLRACATALSVLLAISMPAGAAPQSAAHSPAELSAREIIQESLKRHEFYPFVYEEQTLVLVDIHKQRDVRRIHRYSRLEPDGVFKTRLEFVYPESIAGTSLLFTHHPDGSGSSRIFLPALGQQMTDYSSALSGGKVLGSDFSLQDLIPEDIHRFVYRRENDVVSDESTYFAVRASFAAADTAMQLRYAERLLLVRQDNFFISRVDYFDHRGQLIKRQTRHDTHRVGGKMWRADMITAENMLNHHRSILKIDRRVFSSDYVPESVFDEQQILLAAMPVAQPGAAEASGADDAGTLTDEEQP